MYSTVHERMSAAETFPSASCAFFCAADADADADAEDDDEEEDNEVVRCVRAL
jgi:hypothetical protein